jgi:hypothetical protein
MTIETGFASFIILVTLVVMALVGHATFTAGPDRPKWHRPVGIGILAGLAAFVAFFVWFVWWGGVK